MSVFTNMKIAKRLSLGYGVIMALFALVLAGAFLSLSTVSESLHHIVHVNNVKMGHAASLINHLDDIYIEMGSLLLSTDRDAREISKSRILESRESYRKELHALEALEINEEGKQAIAKLKETLAQAGELNNRVIEMAMAGNLPQGIELYRNQGIQFQKRISREAAAISDYQQGRTKFRSENAETAISRAKLAAGIFATFAMVVAFLFAFFMTRRFRGGKTNKIDFIFFVDSGKRRGYIDSSLTNKKGDYAHVDCQIPYSSCIALQRRLQYLARHQLTGATH